MAKNKYLSKIEKMKRRKEMTETNNPMASYIETTEKNQREFSEELVKLMLEGHIIIRTGIIRGQERTEIITLTHFGKEAIEKLHKRLDVFPIVERQITKTDISDLTKKKEWYKREDY